MLKVFEAFSGIGTQRMALRNIGVEHEVIGISEIDEEAIKSYMAIHGETKNFGDISKVPVEDIPDFDLFTYSFPCTDISLAGKKEGFEEGSNTRSSLLWECKRIIENKKPKFLLLENVKNLVGKKNKPHFNKWLKWLEGQGYHNHWSVENALDFGVGQNRERVFVVSILGGSENDFQFSELVRKPNLPLKAYLEDDNEVDQKYFKTEEQLKKFETWKSFQNPLERIIGRESHSPTLTARGAGLNHSGQILISTAPHNLNLRGKLDEVDLDSLAIRNITPREAWRLTGCTDEDFEKAQAVTPQDKFLYKQVGNAIVVDVLEAIFTRLFK